MHARWEDLADTVFTHVALDDERPNAAMPLALAQDGDGFLWIGTQNGLARWDGYRFRCYQPDPNIPGALPDNFVRMLHTDARGRLWIGSSSGGLARYDRDRDEFISFATGRDGVQAQAPAVAADGNALLVATESGLERIDPITDAITRLPYVEGMPDNASDQHIHVLFRDSSGALWIGTSTGVVCSVDREQRFAGVPLPALADRTPSPRSLFEDGNGRIWIGTLQDGAYVVERPGGAARPVRETGPPSEASLETEGVRPIIEVRPGEIWLGTQGQGIVAVDAITGSTRRLRHDPTLPSTLVDDTIQALHRDRSGLIWIATNRGISRHDPRPTRVASVFGRPNRSGRLSDRDVNAILPLPDGRVWLGGSKGIDVVDPGNGRVVALRSDLARPETALPNDYVNAFARLPDGDVHLGTGQGLFRTDPLAERVVRVCVPGRDPRGSIWTLLYDDGVLWVGGNDGLWALIPDGGAGAGRCALGPSGTNRLSDQCVTVIEPGSAGSLWIGTKNGLNRFDPASGAVERMLPCMTDPDSLSSGYIASLLVDRLGRVWVATLGGGINVLETLDPVRRPRFRRLGVSDGLPNANVDKLLEDATGAIWASTDDGLAVISPDTFAIRALRRAEGVAISAYWANSGAVTPQGELLFGGLGGLTVVRPDQLMDVHYEPPIVVTDIRVGGKPVPASRFNEHGSGELLPGERLTVAPDSNSIAVEFAALEYSAPERNRYAYCLDGYDTAWIETDASRRLAVYANLRPGDYTLRLRGSDRDGTWTRAIQTVPIRIRPAWHQRTGFRLGELGLGIGAVVALVQARTAYLRRHERELERQVTERTAELERRTVELRESEQRLEHLAYSDPLTGLPNRRMFTEDMRKLFALARRRTERFSLLLIDLDGFKHINDSLGHDAGDALLIEVGVRLRAVVREVDCIARLGGDEFAILLAEGPSGGIEQICRRIAKSFGPAMTFRGASVKTSPSIGVASFPEDGETQDRLYKSADLALYAAKRAGRNTWRSYQAAMDTSSVP